MQETLPVGLENGGVPGVDDVVSGWGDQVVLEKGPDWGGVVEVGGRHVFGHPQKLVNWKTCKRYDLGLFRN